MCVCDSLMELERHDHREEEKVRERERESQNERSISRFSTTIKVTTASNKTSVITCKTEFILQKGGKKKLCYLFQCSSHQVYHKKSFTNLKYYMILRTL